MSKGWCLFRGPEKAVRREVALHQEPNKQGGGQPKPEAGFVCSGGFS